MTLSAIGCAVLIAREGRRLAAYRDAVGIWTIGVGHTSAAGPPAVTPTSRLTVAECDALFSRDVARYAGAVRQALPEGLRATLPDHAFDALVSLCFNIGPAAFRRSSVVARLKAGDRDGAAEAILLWNRPAVLIPRRGAEYDQFRTPYSVTLPRARRGDAAPVASPAGWPSSPPMPTPRTSLERRPVRRVPAPPARTPSSRPVAVPEALAGRLWRLVRAAFRR